MTASEVDYAQSARLRAALKRWRSRQRLVTFAAGSSIVAAVLSGVAVPLLVMTPSGPAIRLILVLASVGLAGAIVVAMARTLAPRRIAALADSRLQLDDSLATAVQYADDPDDVSRLIVRDAVTKIRGVSPADVFPLQVSPGVGWGAGAALVASTLVILVTTRPFPADAVRTNPQTAGATSAAGASTDPNVRPQSAAAAGSGRPAPAVQPGLPEQRASHDGTAAQSDDRGNQGASRAGASSSPPQAAASADNSGQAANAIPDLTAAPVSEHAVSARASIPGSSTKTGSAAGAGARAGQAAPGAGGASTRGVNSGSGGSPLPGVVNRPASRPDGGNRHGAPAARAEAALAAGQIPPGLRAYLKNYFSAIAKR